MGDAICKWRAAIPKNVVELVNLLPHTILQENDFREYMEKKMPGFFHTPYQLACQLGLYYIDNNGIYHPRFEHDIGDNEASNYLKVFIRNYYVPNPYTARGFKNLQRPILLERTLVEYLESVGGVSDFESALKEIMKEDVGNLTATKTLLSHSALLRFQGYQVSLQPNYKKLMEITTDRKDKSAFFNIFNLQLTTRKVEGPLQQIFFGAPGTGKSHTIKEVCKAYDHYRITFHPDTDYASFVGAYKPFTETENLYHTILTKDGAEALPVINPETNQPITTAKITYKFVQQAFLKAYVAAWREQEKEEPQPVFLEIEEINRGNCAQIFGDIFQLLDRNEEGFSDYPIHADTDLSKELGKAFADLKVANADGINALYDGKDVVGEIKKGTQLLLPNNLYIWATMNTSDQSLFPIDSAFKRRWDWKYIKIADSGKGYVISVNDKEYDWWQFLQKINNHIGTTTSQEDKKLGYFFAKATKNDDGKYVISADKFLSKVLFFLYGDVYKDYGFDDDIFKGEDGTPMEFSDYFDEQGNVVETKIEKFLQNLGLKPKSIDEESEEIEDVEIEEMFDDSTTSENREITIEGIPSSRNNSFTTITKIALEQAKSTNRSLTLENLTQIAQSSFLNPSGKQMKKVFFIKDSEKDNYFATSNDKTAKDRYKFQTPLFDTNDLKFYAWCDWGIAAEPSLARYADALNVKVAGFNRK